MASNSQSKGFTRRELLKASLLSAAAVCLGSAISRRAHAAWGELPSDIWAAGISGYKILELHCFGGMAPFESFYYRDVAGSRTRGFDTEVGALNWNPMCNNTPSGLETHAFSTDSNGKSVHLGPFAKPLWNNQNIRRRMRVVVQRHDLLPHEAAIPYVATGSRLGRPNQAPPGAAIQHRLGELDMEADNGRVLPHSYALLPETNFTGGALFTLVQQIQSLVGAHPGSSKSMVLKIGNAFGDFITQLNRNNLGATKESVNTLIDQFRAQYRDKLRWQPDNFVTRSTAFSDYDAAASRLMNADTLESLLSGAPQTINPQDFCAREGASPFTTADNGTRAALEFAAYLLTRPANEAASSVFVLDSGIARTGLPYDVHSIFNAADTGTNLWNLLDSLVSVIRDPNNPTPEDANKIDLSETLVVINTDFGRTPFKSSGNIPTPGSNGRDHYPECYTKVLIGGPIPLEISDGVANRVVGSITDGADETVMSDVPYNATDTKAALLMAGGVNPFAGENFALGSLTPDLVVPSADPHHSTMENLRQVFFGVS
ncbi:MAG: DUF1501 domain-containing protein [Candidatus Thiodiazotropha weberae]|nr:DUF1501 domain-containing protein [Candidatus Thiodiazotropha lotti]MCG8012559.1 DUF1501 domain-containing protein [Candidatus Thiodiazotropha lotti]MCG8021378.1 DUF1501 domain-containing protein [Candidatus Thiodiazotropha lotti]MCW4208544.1 DUF1501 domain-containing protein [Candidatus Thiodiazotropha lotti]MCW4212029.1 DUF1501 domain-containing protein [Candidatus Thiodiazotropha lotti]